MPYFKHNLSIHAHTKKNSARSSLFLVVSVNGERKEVPTGITLPSSAYNKQTNTITKVEGYPNAPLDNLRLQQIIAEVNRIFLAYELTPSSDLGQKGQSQVQNGSAVPTLATILTDINTYLHPEQAKPQLKASTVTVLEAFDKYLSNEQLNAGWSEGTLRHKKVIRKHLATVYSYEFLQNINDESLLLITAHLSKILKAKTLAKYLSDIRVFLHWCQKQGLYNGKSHETFSPVIKGASDPKEIIYLTFDELNLLKNRQWSLSELHLERVVDSFLFSCFCGLRHSDIYNLKRSKIVNDTISIRTKKTGVNIDIPLNDHTKRILNKYKDYHDAKDHPFPVITDQKSNQYIKEACKLCGIDSPLTISYYQDGKLIEETKPKYEWISFHCARRTFISCAFQLGIPAEVIIKFSGHANLKQLKPYLAIAEKTKRDNMSLFNNI